MPPLRPSAPTAAARAAERRRQLLADQDELARRDLTEADAQRAQAERMQRAVIETERRAAQIRAEAAEARREAEVVRRERDRRPAEILARQAADEEAARRAAIPKLTLAQRKAQRDAVIALSGRLVKDDADRQAQVIQALPRLWDRFYDKIGVELEGGWDRERHDAITRCMHLRSGEPWQAVGAEGVERWNPAQRSMFPAARICGDGSVSVPGRANLVHVGELDIGPTASVDGMEKALAAMWPTVCNASCGYHIHLSFKREIYYLRLMDPEVTSLIVTALGEWGRAVGLPGGHPLWARLGGENTYCFPVYRGDTQVACRTKGGERYTALNYCKGLHGTLEVRILPMFATAEQGISAMRQVITTLGMWLHTKRGSERAEALAETAEVEETDTVTHLDETQAGFRAYQW